MADVWLYGYWLYETLKPSLLSCVSLQGHHCALQREELTNQSTHVPRTEETL